MIAKIKCSVENYKTQRRKNTLYIITVITSNLLEHADILYIHQSCFLLCVFWSWGLKSGQKLLVAGCTSPEHVCVDGSSTQWHNSMKFGLLSRKWQKSSDREDVTGVSMKTYSFWTQQHSWSLLKLNLIGMISEKLIQHP